MRKQILAAAAFGFLVSLEGRLLGETRYGVLPFENTPEMWSIRVGPLNDAGHGAGAADTRLKGRGLTTVAILWAPPDPIRSLGLLPDAPPRASSSGWGINIHDHVAGYAGSATPEGPGVEAFLWTPEDGMMGLGDLPGGIFYSNARGINDLDQVVGTTRVTNNANEAFLWERARGMIGLGDLPGGVFNSHGFAINNRSEITGWSTSAFGPEAFIWDPVNGMRALGSAPDGSYADTGYAINNLGQIAGFGYTPRGLLSFFWDPQAGFSFFGFTEGNFPYNYGWGINDAGQVVGLAAHDTDDIFGFLWDRKNGFRLLDDLLSAGTPPDYKHILHAADINNRGQISASVRGTGVILQPFVLADMNCDGVVDNLDVDPFVLALTDYAAYEQQYPDCHGDWAGDVNQDGAFDNFDIDPFVDCVTNGCP